MINEKFILILILTFGLQSSAIANNIKDFQIEGMSIGDSLLQYFTKKEIRTEKKNMIKYPNSKKYSGISFYNYPILQQYDSVQANIKTKDKKYIIQGISGIKFYDNNIEECKKKMKEIYNEVGQMFAKANFTKKTKKHEYDKTNKSLIHQYLYIFDNGAQFRIECYDWSKIMFKKHQLEDQLVVTILNEEFSYFMANEAYK